ncbi:APC family permease [Pseudomonas segetis]|uniref:Amino acid/polyamine/organocation transporter, APC superfamily n=1 Tax=Pseudomonas segetis TaxID=298908 RepID=A0A239H700_9PSED|nr:APC family permease [Pseudomonas segetis]SNS76925.1 amino acid/polyamine/organocation transporter, APC superfamily [Pseudomonas segetis]
MSNNKKFARVLGSTDVIALAFGAMVGWGWVVLAGTMISNAGTGGTMLAFAIGGTAVIMIGLAYAELAAAMPQNGGEHVYAHRALGAGASFFCTWAIILGYVSVVAFEAVALPTVLEELIPGYKVGLMYSIAGWEVYFTWALVGIVGAIGMTWLNIRGVKSSALFQAVITVLILAVGIMLISGSLFNGSSANTEPLFIGGVGGVFSVIIMTPFLFVGFDVIPQAAEEIDLPFRKIGIILIVSVLMAVAWYILIMYATGRALDVQALAGSKLATADAATAVLGGSWAGKLLVLAGLGGILTSWNAFLIGGSRAVYAMAEAKMLPAFLAKLHPTYKTPVNAILLIGALSIIAPLFGRQALVWLVDAGGLGIVVAYAMVALSFIVLRRNEPDMERPFRAGRGPWVGYVALLLSLGLVLLYTPVSPSALLPVEWLLVGVWAVLGAVLYGYSCKVYGSVEIGH